MTDVEFEEEWRAKFEKLRSEVLLWEKPFRPAIPTTIDEEVVVAHLKALDPFRKRAKMWPLSTMDKIVRAPFFVVLACCNVYTGIGPLFFKSVWLAGCSLWLILPIICSGSGWYLLGFTIAYIIGRWIVINTLSPLLNIILYK